MKINCVNFFSINPKEMLNIKQVRPGLKYLSHDVFEKKVSFRGNKKTIKEDKPFFSTNDIDMMDRDNALNYFLDCMLDIERDSKESKINMGSRVSIHRVISAYISNLKQTETEKEAITNAIQKAGFYLSDDYRDLNNIYRKNQQTFVGHSFEFLKIYTHINNKSNITKYGELLLDILNREEDKEEPDYNALNEYSSFLNAMEIENIEDFKTKFGHLSKTFNDYGTIFDVKDAIDSIRPDFDKKIELLGEITQTKKAAARHDLLKLYFKEPDVIDYFFENNNKENLSGLENIIQYIGNVKNKGYVALSEDFNEYKRTIDKIELYQFFSESKVSPNDINGLTSESIVDGISVKEKMAKYSPIIEALAEFKGVKKDDVRKEYISLAGLYDATYDINNKDTSKIEKLAKIIQANKINNESQFLRLYNKLYQTNKTKLDKDDVNDIVELSSYALKYDLSKTTASNLKKTKETTEGLISEIDEYLSQNKETCYELGTSSEIFDEFKEEFLKKKEPVSKTLDRITRLQTQNDKDYQHIRRELERFSEIIPDEDDLHNFLFTNEISLRNNQDDNDNRELYLTVLNLFSDKESDKTFEYLKETYFIKNSKAALESYIKKYGPDKNLKSAIELCAQNNIESISELDIYLNTANLSLHSAKLFTEFSKQMNENPILICDMIAKLNEKIKDKNFPLKINGSNLLDFTPEDLREGECTPDIVGKLYRKKPEELFKSLPETYIWGQRWFGRNDIAGEIAEKIAENMRREKFKSESFNKLLKYFGFDMDSGDEPHIFNLFKTKGIGYCRTVIASMISDEFVQMVNSQDLLPKDSCGRFLNLSLHAKLRFIERYLLIDTPQGVILGAKSNKKLLNKIFSTKPVNISMTQDGKKFIVISQIGYDTIKTIISKEGGLITIYPPFGNPYRQS